MKRCGVAVEVDARGLPCPRPVVNTRKALQDAPGETIVVLVDSPESRDNVIRFAESQGRSVDVISEGDTFRLEIAGGRPVEAKSAACRDLVLITSERFGTGDARLGEILMKAFLNTLWDADSKPTKIFFVNDGVRLTTEGSESLETLQLLEEAGVTILSCGTCLEFYGIKDRLRVGLVTNMFDTVDSLLSAEKVIRI